MASICQYEATAVGRLGSQTSGRSWHGELLHVLTLTPFYPSADDDAAGCFVAEPLRFLSDLGVKNSVIAVRPFYRGGGARANSAAHSATWVRYAAVPAMAGLVFSGGGLYLRIRGAVQRLHAAEPFSLIHAHGALPCGHAAARLARDLQIPFVVTVHGRDVFSSRRGGPVGEWCKRISAGVYRSSARVICISEKVQEDLLSGVRCRSSVVHNGVDAEMFCPATSQENDPIVLSVGNLIRTKGHETLLRAVTRLREDYPRLRCQIIGVGPERQRLEHLARQLGISHRVEFLGRQSRACVAQAMQGCSAFALPSTYEGLGCVYLEAMATGKPAIGCLGQGIAEVIQSEKNGWLVSPDDTEELSNALHQLLRDSALRIRMGEAGRRRVVENFTLRCQAEKLTHIYQEHVL
jgi:glycosyltransferase involved in cell wall biosynthesis